MPASQPPSPGPSTMPTPIAAPITPMPPPRFSSDVLSPMKAMAVGMVAAERMPPKARAAKSIHSWVERPKSSNEMALPVTPKRSKGLRPTRSESWPQMGAKMNCMMAKMAMSRPNSLPPAPKSVT